MKRITVYIGTEQHAKLTQLAKSTGMKFAEHLRRALDVYLEGLVEKNNDC